MDNEERLKKLEDRVRWLEKECELQARQIMWLKRRGDRDKDWLTLLHSMAIELGDIVSKIEARRWWRRK